MYRRNGSYASGLINSVVSKVARSINLFANESVWAMAQDAQPITNAKSMVIGDFLNKLVPAPFSLDKLPCAQRDINTLGAFS